MKIQKMRYTEELIKNKVRLQRELNMIEVELEELRKDCDHIYIVVGNDDNYYHGVGMISECVFCGDVIEGETPNDKNVVYAYTYKRPRYSNGYNKEQRQQRLDEIKELVFGYLEKNKKLKNETIIKRLNKVVKEDEEKNKVMEKTIGMKFI